MKTKTERQIAKTLTFAPDVVLYIDWTVIANERAELNCQMDVRTQPDGGLTVELFWFNQED